MRRAKLTANTKCNNDNCTKKAHDATDRSRFVAFTSSYDNKVKTRIDIGRLRKIVSAGYSWSPTLRLANRVQIYNMYGSLANERGGIKRGREGGQASKWTQISRDVKQKKTNEINTRESTWRREKRKQSIMLKLAHPQAFLNLLRAGASTQQFG